MPPGTSPRESRTSGSCSARPGRRPLHQVVQAADHDEPVGARIHHRVHQALVVAQRLLGLRAARCSPARKRRRRKIPRRARGCVVGVRILGDLSMQRRVARAENAAGHGDQVRQEGEVHRVVSPGFLTNCIQLLADLWQMAMAVHRVGPSRSHSPRRSGWSCSGSGPRRKRPTCCPR